MLKIRTTPNLLILGTVFSLFAISALANNVSPPFSPAVNSNVPARQPSTEQSLGVLHEGDYSGSQNSASAVNQNGQPVMRSASSDASPPDILEPVQSGNITYVTGGIGDEERSALKTVEQEYNLHIMSATKDGAFAGETRIIILDHNGGELVNTPSGPIFFAKLPSGSYTVEATRGGSTKKQNVSVGRTKSSKVHFSWQ